MDKITTEERMIVDKLRNHTIHDVTPKMLKDSSLFYRFAKARDFNLSEAEDMLKKHISFRKEMHADDILAKYKPSEVILKYAPTSFICLDKKGCIVRNVDCGRADGIGLWNCTTLSDIMKFSVYNIEHDIDLLSKRGRKAGKPVYYAIIDLDHFTYTAALHLKNLNFAITFAKMFTDNYPETLRSVLIINAPFYFSFIWAAVKQVLPAVVIQKIQIFGADGWKEHLLENVNPDELPAYLGGNKVDPDGNPFCPSFMCLGKPIPKSYYRNKREKKLAQLSDVEKFTVLPLGKKEICFEVTDENSYLEWEFETKSKDIDFSLLFTTESSEDFGVEELIPKQRIDASDEPKKGCLKCEKMGNYIVVFDNSYSWVHLKVVYFRARIITPKSN